jgi:hypothetical protein
VTPLPRSLAPLAEESLPGYLLRLAHRLDTSPGRVAELTGIAAERFGLVPASRMLALTPAQTAAFAHATRLTAEEVTTLTLIDLAPRYPHLDLRFLGRQREIHGLFVKENWVFSRATRYCPQCLAGDGEPIGQRHGGAWSRLWRLPVVFACPIHRTLLRHTCPSCGNPAHRRTSGGGLLSVLWDSTLHPAACRTPLRAGTKHRTWPCGHRLDYPATEPGPPAPPDLLLLQSRLLNLLTPTNSPATHRTPADTARDFIDLRILTCLLTATWPTGRELVHDPGQAQLFDDHVAATREEIQATLHAGRTIREIHLYDRPPLHAATGAALLAAAERLAATGDPDELHRCISPLMKPAHLRIWTRQFLRDQGFCSPRLHYAIALELGLNQIEQQTGITPPAPAPQPRPMRFGPEHIPPYLLDDWHQTFLASITAAKPRLVRRAAAIRLAQISIGGGTDRAIRALAIPPASGRNALANVKQQLGTDDHRRFDDAIEALAVRLQNADDRTDYGRRREALKSWSIAPEEWDALIDGLPEQPIGDQFWTHTHWGDGKRILASVWIWTWVTGGEHIFAPPVRPDPDAIRPGGALPHYVHHRWPFISAGQGHYRLLRERLDVHAKRIATDIDTGRFLTR